MTNMGVLAAALLLAVSAGAFRTEVGKKALVGHEGLESIPMHTYKSDCWKSRPVSLMQKKNPGAGIKEFTPYERVEKDGFFEVECVKDYMFTHGDKFGDNKHEYALGEVSNVSIVHYTAHVAKADRKEMTQKICFEFCRTVPDMQAFGLLNGRECYCAPYYKPMASDSSECDATCPGDSSTMCGGKSKSSIFAMHMCASTEEDLGIATGKAGDLKSTLDSAAGNAKSLSGDMNDLGNSLQAAFGKVGDSAAGDLMQAAKVSAGKLEHKGEDAKKVATALGDLKTKAGKLSDFKDPEEVTSAERIMEDVEETLADGVKVGEELDALIALASPGLDDNDQAKQYYNIMYFVDKDHKDDPSTCGGDAVGEPIVGESEDGCAAACDADVHNCVGFSYFGKDGGICFLMSKFKTATYYTGCGGGKGKFLQTMNKAAPYTVTCMAKLSSFDGTTLKPDGSGKCKQCLKEAKNANRCFA